jgi:DNA-binding transcriptional ArsR family regulator
LAFFQPQDDVHREEAALPINKPLTIYPSTIMILDNHRSYRRPTMDDTRLEQLSTLFKALADPARLRILGRLAERPHAGHELAGELALTPPTISHHMRKLVAAGLVDVTAEAQSRIYSLRAVALRDLAREAPAENPEESPAETDAVLRAFFDGPRLRHLPAARKKRVIVLRRLLERFEANRSYPEREVNDLLRLAHDDVASLRRELVDYGFMVRDRGIYRIASELPDRGPSVRQEVGNEAEWFPALVAAATKRAVSPGQAPHHETRSVPRE